MYRRCVLKTFVFCLIVCACAFSRAYAEQYITYFQDPVFKSLNPDDPHPMSDVIVLAEDGDVRAQFILGDLYAKGKSSLEKDEKIAAQWFQRAAAGGYPHAFVRLAAMAKRQNDPVMAYAWYTLAIRHFSDRDWRAYAIAARTELKETAALTVSQLDTAKKEVNVFRARVMRKKQMQDQAKVNK